MTRDPEIKAKAMVVLPNDEFTAHAVAVLAPSDENPAGYHRLIGGTIEPGETSRAAVSREVREELDAELLDVELLGTVESIYTINGDPGHQVVFVFAARIDPPVPPGGSTMIEADGTASPIVWRPLMGADLPLYPDVEPLLRRLPRPGLDREAQRAATIAAYDDHADAHALGTVASPSDVASDLAAFAGGLGGSGLVLEIGSGPGRDAAALEAHGLHVERTDITPAFVERLRAAGHLARLLDPLRDELGGPYAGVWASAVLLHLNRPEMAITLDRLRRATLPGGLLHLSLKEGDGSGWSRHGTVDAPRFFTYWREAELREVLAAAGWRVDHVARREGRTSGESWLTTLCHVPT